MRTPVRPICLSAACVVAVSLASVHAVSRRAAVGVAVGAAPPPAVVARDPRVRAVADADTAFTFRLLGALTRSAPEKNVFFSPFSVGNALSLVLNGAGGATRRDIARTLSLEAVPLDQVNAGNGLLLPSLENPDPRVELTVANALWAGRGVRFARGFQARCRRFYGADATTLDLAGSSAADTINAWVSRNTRGKISRLVSAGDLDRATAVLTDAVYFHGRWTAPFEPRATESGAFTLADGHWRTVPLMTRRDTFRYQGAPQFQAVRLPYGAGRVSLYVFLPRRGTTLPAFLAGLDAPRWRRCVGAMRPTRVTLSLPRFNAEYAAELNAPLTSLGMGGAFGQGADFAPMGLGGSFVSAVLHKAVLRVDETGTEAAAATAVTMEASVRRVEPPSVVVRVDHPFFLAVRDDLTGTVLFAGAIYEPTA